LARGRGGAVEAIRRQPIAAIKPPRRALAGRGMPAAVELSHSCRARRSMDGSRCAVHHRLIAILPNLLILQHEDSGIAAQKGGRVGWPGAIRIALALAVQTDSIVFFCLDVRKGLDRAAGSRIMVGLGWLATCWAAGIFYSSVGQFEAGAWRPGFGASA